MSCLPFAVVFPIVQYGNFQEAMLGAIICCLFLFGQYSCPMIFTRAHDSIRNVELITYEFSYLCDSIFLD